MLVSNPLEILLLLLESVQLDRRFGGRRLTPSEEPHDPLRLVEQIIQSTIWDDFDESFKRTNLTATWFEIVMITEKHMSNNLALGAKIRFRHLTNFINEYNPEVIAIPGYGKAFNSNVPAVNLYIKYRLEF